MASITSNKGTCEPVARNSMTANKITPCQPLNLGVDKKVQIVFWATRTNGGTGFLCLDTNELTMSLSGGREGGEDALNSNCLELVFFPLVRLWSMALGIGSFGA
jgi:hypothetical protein